jgi:hypothetical protein
LNEDAITYSLTLAYVLAVDIDQLGCNFHTYELATDGTGATLLPENPAGINFVQTGGGTPS